MRATMPLWTRTASVMVSLCTALAISCLLYGTSYADCLESLQFAEVDFYIERIPAASPGTNQWLWNNPTLQAWRQANSGILWIQGKPGSGKSVLARTIVERGRTFQRQESDVQAMAQDKIWVSAYRWIYSRRFEDVYTNHIYMLRSLLFQILKHNKRDFQHVQEFWRKNRHDLRTRSYCLSELQEMLYSICEHLDRVVLFIIDGFDEGTLAPHGFPQSPNSRREDVLLFLVGLASKCKLVKFVLLSRPETDIDHILSEHPYCYTLVLEHENDNDIRMLIDTQLKALEPSLRANNATGRGPSKEMQSLGAKTQSKRVANLIRKGNEHMAARVIPSSEIQKSSIERIREYLATHAKGVFLWVNLIFRELRDLTTQGLVSWSDIERAIEGLLTDLIKMYENITRDIETRHSKRAIEKAQKALEWVCVASTINGEFTLQILRDALSIPPMDQMPSSIPTRDPFENFRSFDETWLSYRRSLYQLCGPFIDVVRPKNQDPESFGARDIVQLIHTTAKDFLTSKQAGPLRIVIEDARYRVEKDVQSYLFLSFPIESSAYCPLPASGTCNWETNIEKMLVYLEEKPLLQFALMNFAESSELLPEWIVNVGEAALPSSLLAAFNYKDKLHADKDNVLKYAHNFYAGFFENESNRSIAISAVVGKFFCDGCCLGLDTAIENLIAIHNVAARQTTDHSLIFGMLNGTLIAAICQQLKTPIIHLALRNRSGPHVASFFDRPYRIPISVLMPYLSGKMQSVNAKEGKIFKMVKSFLELTIQYGARENLHIFYDHIVQFDDTSPSHSKLVAARKMSLARQLANSPDPLSMLSRKPGLNKADLDSTLSAIDIVIKAFLTRLTRGRLWKKPIAIVKSILAFRKALRNDFKRLPVITASSTIRIDTWFGLSSGIAFSTIISTMCMILRLQRRISHQRKRSDENRHVKRRGFTRVLPSMTKLRSKISRKREP